MNLRTIGSRAAMVACMIALVPAIGLGQERRGGPPGGRDLDAVMVELTEKLELTEGQAGEIRELLEKQRTESRKLLEEVRASGEGRAGMAGMRERMTAIRDATSAAVKEILNAEQNALYEALQAERRERRPGGPGGP